MTIRGLHVISDRSLISGNDLRSAVAEASRAGAAAIHLREPGMLASELLRLAIELRQLIQPETLLFVNDRLDVALVAGADGVQLGESGLPPEAVRRIAPKDFIIGRSVHSLSGALESIQSGADFLLVGTVFPSRSHPGGATGGVELIREVRGSTVRPIIAIGGIDSGNAASVLEAGADGVAVISAVLGAADVYSAAKQLVEILESIPAGTRE